MDTLFLQVGKAHADAVTRKKSPWLSQIGYLPFRPLNLDNDFTMHGLFYRIRRPSEKNQLSISQELAISSLFQQGSNKRQMLFSLSQTALCHCIHCLAISFSGEWREPGLVLSAVLISESSKEVCTLSEHRHKHLAESLPRSLYSLVVITVVLSLCLQSSGLMLWTESLSWGLYGHGKMKKEGKEHWRGSSAQT